MKWEELSKKQQLVQILIRLHDVKTNHDKTAKCNSEIVIDYLKQQWYIVGEESGEIEIEY